MRLTCVEQPIFLKPPICISCSLTPFLSPYHTWRDIIELQIRGEREGRDTKKFQIGGTDIKQENNHANYKEVIQTHNFPPNQALIPCRVCGSFDNNLNIVTTMIYLSRWNDVNTFGCCLRNSRNFSSSSIGSSVPSITFSSWPHLNNGMAISGLIVRVSLSLSSSTTNWALDCYLSRSSLC